MIKKIYGRPLSVVDYMHTYSTVFNLQTDVKDSDWYEKATQKVINLAGKADQKTKKTVATVCRSLLKIEL